MRETKLAKTISIVSLESFPLVKAGDNIAKLIVETMKREGVSLSDGDIVAIAQKVVSKAEGRIARLRDVDPSEKAKEIAKTTQKDSRLVELILRETDKIVKASPQILIVEGKNGFVCMNAGIDKSNVQGDDAYALLPIDPDESARKIRSGIFKLTGKNVAVVVCDTYSRPFRRAQVEFAIGIAGINPFKDYRGQEDLFGYVLKVKKVAIADEIASAAELAMGQGKEAAPLVIIKNLNRVERVEKASAKDLLISKQEDLFSGTL
jgi:coenzyme F420-0:L-glutamate ligase/coenzyme F420-1:gamma-L-glutamate ligase